MFRERLNELLKINGVSQSDLARHLNCSPQAVSNWCREDKSPDYRILIEVANYFQVSVDYLLGNEKNVEKIKESENEKQALYNALVNAGYMKNGEDLSDEELDKIMDYIKTNKKFIKGNK